MLFFSSVYFFFFAPFCFSLPIWSCWVKYCMRPVIWALSSLRYEETAFIFVLLGLCELHSWLPLALIFSYFIFVCFLTPLFINCIHQVLIWNTLNEWSFFWLGTLLLLSLLGPELSVSPKFSLCEEMSTSDSRRVFESLDFSKCKIKFFGSRSS